MLKFNKTLIAFSFTILMILSIFLLSCSSPRSSKYKRHRHVGSSSYYRNSSFSKNKAKRNVIPIAKNYRIKNSRTRGNY